MEKVHLNELDNEGLAHYFNKNSEVQEKIKELMEKRNKENETNYMIINYDTMLLYFFEEVKNGYYKRN
ncbi:hypothetical protein R6Z02_14965 [Carnobacterium maltaromaticum]|uniref:hypothetical protein n=1 Tax=Carnobacterium maltaromaticum TaxID=2751 RepID=UPI00298B0543|nr:hypothetical protein [Carnobacterium maltaromaticum]MDW5525055.1 hypothetical protein [Carnobacterium maltaromaticum]